MNQAETSSTFLGLKLSNRNLLIIVLLLTVVCLFPTLQNDWVNWDDDSYVLRNPLVHSLSGEHLSAHFTTPHQVGHYHPLTMISLAIDYHFWAADAFGFHLTNLLFHLLNTTLVFFLMKRLSTSLLVAFIVSLLFGIHPMHVESVAWISSRKDVLYTFFFLLSILSYLRYRNPEEKRKIMWYASAVFLFAISLLSKSLGFTLPFLLLLIDYLNKRAFNRAFIIDKIPFFFLGIIGAWLATFGQQASGTMSTFSEFSFDKTLFIGSENAMIYAIKSIIPVRLSIFHPFPTGSEIQLTVLAYLSGVVALIVLFVLFRSFKRFRPLFFGLSFFLVSIGPVLQIIPNGKAVMSERYTYVAYIGLFYLIALSIEYTFKKVKEHKALYSLLVGLSCSWFLFLGVQTYQQSNVWKNSETLWTQAIERYPDSYWVYLCRGTHRLDHEDLSGAFADLNKSIDLNPTADALYERGRMYEVLGNRQLAFNNYSSAIDLDINYSRAYLNRGILFAQDAEFDKALEDLDKAVEIDKNYALAHFNRGLVHKLRGNGQEALRAFSTAIELEPSNTLFLRNRGVLNDVLKNYDAAIMDFGNAILLEPNSSESYFLRSNSYFHKNEIEAALKDAQTASDLGMQLPEEYLKQLRDAD